MAQFFNMGGYGGFVWSAWGIALVVLGGLLTATLIARRQVRRELEQRGLDRQRRRGGEAHDA